MALTQYCELDEVRAALGVNDVELPDTVLNLFPSTRSGWFGNWRRSRRLCLRLFQTC